MTEELTGTAEFVRSKLTGLDVVTHMRSTPPNVLEFTHTPQFVGSVPTRERLHVLSSPMLSLSEVERVCARDPSVTAIVNTGKDTHYSGEALEAARFYEANVLTFRQLLSAVGRQGGLASFEDGRIRFCLETFSKSKSVARMELICETEMLAVRPRLGDLRLVATSIYTFGSADLMKELNKHPDLDVIVNLNNYNHFTPDAHKRARELGKALVPGNGVFDMLRRERGDILADG